MAKKSPKQNQAESKASSRKGRSPSSAIKAGKQFERDVAMMLRHIFPEAERQLESQQSSCTGVDLKGTDPYKIQCKNYAGYVSISKIREVQAKSGDVPVLVSKGINLRPVAVLYLDDFIKMLEQIKQAETQIQIVSDTLKAESDSTSQPNLESFF